MSAAFFPWLSSPQVRILVDSKDTVWKNWIQCLS